MPKKQKLFSEVRMQTLCKDLLLLSDEVIWLDMRGDRKKAHRKSHLGKPPFENTPSPREMSPRKNNLGKQKSSLGNKTPGKSPPEKSSKIFIFGFLNWRFILIKITVVPRFFEHWIFRIPPLFKLSFWSSWFACFNLILYSLNCLFQSHRSNYSNFCNPIKENFWKCMTFLFSSWLYNIN